ncbi:restriction endonuclease subunit S [Lactobacillus delbrueckii]|uniref:restriction endonuclease subunit S n=1 Tax=Lactobacillus delbrueckii TaxID=1584 RepID=UPI001107EF18|nr:restriction endonuclease subunit S [Lactobacillus delbrueckii]TLQ28198.1 restriction endonuclease subunit S [Lactobacillus delbrueckii subsp. lactis]
MNDTQAKYPQLRFKGFADPWEQCKLGDVADRFDNLRVPVIANLRKNGDTPYYGANGIQDYVDGYTHDGEYILVAEDGANNLKNYPINYVSGRIWVNNHAHVLQAIPYLASTRFLGYEIGRSNIVSLLVGGGRAKLNADALMNMNLNLPKIKEQELIADLFQKVEISITLHEEKKRQLERLKSALLQKMFADKSGYPAVRFEGFGDEWEERKLSDLFIKGGSGGTPKSTNKDFYDGDIPFLGISDITKSNGFINNTEKHISSDGLNSSAAWIVSKGAISLAMYASVGKLAILNIDAATSQAFYNMIFDDYDLRDLVYQRLNKANELSEWNKLISTGTQSNLNADKVKNFQMYLPKNHDEIKLISTFFKKIDNAIALHQRKLDLLKEQKKGFLQKMFV